MTDVTSSQPYLDQIKAVQPTLPGANIDWMASLRQAAAARFAATGFPHRKAEAFKYADLRALEKTPFVASAPSAGDAPHIHADDLPWLDMPGARLAFVDGHFRADLSHLSDETHDYAKPVSAALLHAELPGMDGFGQVSDAHAFDQLNAALAGDGLWLHAPEGRDLGIIQILDVASGAAPQAAGHLRHAITLEAGARAHLIERSITLGGGAAWSNAVHQITLGVGARLDHNVWQSQSGDAMATALTMARVDADSLYNRFTLSTGAASARSEIRVHVVGEGAHVDLSGVQLGRARQVLDTVTHLAHEIGHATSNQTYRAVVDEKARTAFSGKVYVARDAQKTDAQQSSRNLLLARTAEANTKPELEIYADDVLCAHGATVGELDKQALFYLASRGVDPIAAQGILVQAFISDVIEKIEDDAVRDAYLEATATWLEAQL